MANQYLVYAVKEDDGGGYSAYIPEFPTVCAGGESVDEAVYNAKSGAMLAMDWLVEARRPLLNPVTQEEGEAQVRAERAKDGLATNTVVCETITLPLAEEMGENVGLDLTYSEWFKLIDLKAKLNKSLPEVIVHILRQSNLEVKNE